MVGGESSSGGDGGGAGGGSGSRSTSGSGGGGAGSGGSSGGARALGVAAPAGRVVPAARKRRTRRSHSRRTSSPRHRYGFCPFPLLAAKYETGRSPRPRSRRLLVVPVLWNTIHRDIPFVDLLVGFVNESEDLWQCLDLDLLPNSRVNFLKLLEFPCVFLGERYLYFHRRPVMGYVKTFWADKPAVFS